ncbi:MAG: hypothetical protein GY928_30330, partial [Colwellia sp.]|nr:hypothetical protein [Colwellia sp.]
MRKDNFDCKFINNDSDLLFQFEQLSQIDPIQQRFANPTEKRVLQKPFPYKSVRKDNNSINELPHIHPIFIPSAAVKIDTSPTRPRTATITECLAAVDEQKGWTDSDIAIFGGFWSLHAMEMATQNRKRLRKAQTKCTSNVNNKCGACFVQIRQSEIVKEVKVIKHKQLLNKIHSTKLHSSSPFKKYKFKRKKRHFIHQKRIINDEFPLITPYGIGENYSDNYNPTLNA